MLRQGVCEPIRRITKVNRAAEPALGLESAGAGSDTDNSDGHLSAEKELKIWVSKTVAQLRKTWVAQQRTDAQQELAANQRMLAEKLRERRQQVQAWPSLPIPKSAFPAGARPADGGSKAPCGGAGGAEQDQERLHDEDTATSPGDVQPTRPARRPDSLPQRDIVRNKVLADAAGGARWAAVTANTVPAEQPVPTYKAWAYLARNELAVHTGRQMYYTDDLGETVPASDSEEDASDEQSLEGVTREREEYVLRGIAQEYRGLTAKVIKAIAEKLGVAAKAVDARLQEIAGAARSVQAADITLQTDLSAALTHMSAHLCRRCRIFNCLLHDVQHPRPLGRTSASKPAADAGPCGTRCYKLQEAPPKPLASLSAVMPAAAASGIISPTDDSSTEEGAGPSGDRSGTHAVNGSLHAAGQAVNGAAKRKRRKHLAAGDTAVPEGKRGHAGSASDHGLSGEALHQNGLRKESPTASAGTASGRQAPQHEAAQGKQSAPIEISSNSDNPASNSDDAAAATSHPSLASCADAQALQSGGTSTAQRLPGSKRGRKMVSAGQVAVKPEPGNSGAKQGVDRPATQQPDADAAAPSAVLPSGDAEATASAAGQLHELNNEPPAGLATSSSGASDQQDGIIDWMSNVAQQGAKQLTVASAALVGQMLHSAPRIRGSTSPATSAIEAIGVVQLNGDCTAGRDGEAATSKADDWTTFERTCFEKGMQLFGWEACRIARLVGSRSCTQVRARLLGSAGQLPSPVQAEVGGGGRGRGRWRGRDKRKSVQPLRRKNASQVVIKRLHHSKEEVWPAYTACECAGQCGRDCSCIARKNFCEKFCACAPTCNVRFHGCDCGGATRCRTRTCPCYAAGRECDPDLCKKCTPTCSGTAEPGMECYNMRLRLRQHKRVAMGLSTVAGWGTFLQEPARKNELLGEYTGELISQEEADRRGKVYDRDDNSYLFNLNQEWVIDARQRGNKLRFANHSTDPNCRAEILMVDGDHRVGIFAGKDISAGSELFYDYRYDEEHAPRWAKQFVDLSRPGSARLPSGGAGRAVLGVEDGQD